MTVRMDRMEDAPVRMPDGLKGIGMGLGVNGEPLKNVSQHLRSTNSTISDMNMGGGGGSGILGAVPNLGSALSNVVNTPGLAGLASAAGGLTALQGLTGVQNQFLANNLNELGLGNLNPSLVANTLGGNAFSALSANLGNQHMGSGNLSSANLMGGNQMGQGTSMSSFGRGDNSNMYLGGQGQGMNRDFNSGKRDYEPPSARSNFDMKFDKPDTEYRDDFRQQSNPLYTTVNNGSQRVGAMTNKDPNYQSDTVVVTNVSITIYTIKITSIEW